MNESRELFLRLGCPHQTCSAVRVRPPAALLIAVDAPFLADIWLGHPKNYLFSLSM